MSITSESKWLVLLHQLPPKPDYLRVRIRRRLAQLGAVPLKNAAYVLPFSDGALEDFAWLAREIEGAHGTAIVMASQFVSGVEDAELVQAFHALHTEAYAAIAAEAQQALEVNPAGLSDVLLKLRKQLEQAAVRDRLGAPAREVAETALAELAQLVEVRERRPAAERPIAMTWVTRRDVFVDRIACAWLIRRFIDPKARFKFVAPQGFQPAAGEIGFDLFDGIGYSHRGDLCTFETLVQEFGLAEDPGLRSVGEIVHDLDLRDEKFSRGEAPGVFALLQGIVTRYAADAERIEHGRRLFDQLYSHLSRKPLDI